METTVSMGMFLMAIAAWLFVFAVALVLCYLLARAKGERDREAEKLNTCRDALVGIHCNVFPDEARDDMQAHALIQSVHACSRQALVRAGHTEFRQESGMRHYIAKCPAKNCGSSCETCQGRGELTQGQRDAYYNGVHDTQARLYMLTVGRMEQVCPECDGHGWGMNAEDAEKTERGELDGDAARVAVCEKCGGRKWVDVGEDGTMEPFARDGFTAYSNRVGGASVTGALIPPYDTAIEQRPIVGEGWKAAAEAILSRAERDNWRTVKLSDGFVFGVALEALKSGRSLRRPHWDRSLRVYYCGDANDGLRPGDGRTVPFQINGDGLDGYPAEYVPTADDLMADDWCVADAGEEADIGRSTGKRAAV